MNIIVYDIRIIVIQCPLAHACRLRSPLDDLAERLRREMQHGRDYPADFSAATVNPRADFRDRFQYN